MRLAVITIALAGCYQSSTHDEPPPRRPLPASSATTTIATTVRAVDHCAPTPYAGCAYENWIDRCGTNGERCK